MPFHELIVEMEHYALLKTTFSESDERSRHCLYVCEIAAERQSCYPKSAQLVLCNASDVWLTVAVVRFVKVWM